MRHNNKFSDNKQMSHIRCDTYIPQVEYPIATTPDVLTGEHVLTPYQIAVQNGRTEITAYIIEKGLEYLSFSYINGRLEIYYPQYQYK